MEPLAEKALQAVDKGEITVVPERFEKVRAFRDFFYPLHLGSFDFL